MEFRQKYIQGDSAATTDARGLLSGHFDLLVVAPSWDSRSVVITGSSEFSADDCILLLFPGRDPAGNRDRNERHLLDFAHRYCTRVLPVSGPSLSLDDTWNSLWQAIMRKAREAGRPLKLALDLSTFPRFYSLAAIAGCLRFGYVSTISVLYCEGQYEPDAGSAGALAPEYPFSVGEWDTVPIPFLQGRRAPGNKKYVVVSVGFEGSKTLRVLAREDPDRISLLFPDPGSKPGYPAIAEEKNKLLVEMYDIPPSQIVRTNAADAISAWKELGQSALERPETENTYYLSCGTKAHALGMALRAVCLEFPCVLYNVPERHNYVQVTATGQYWTFHIRDLSIVPR